MLIIFILVMIAGMPMSEAGEWRLLEIDKMDLEYSKLNPSNRDPYAPEYTDRWKDRTSLKWNLEVLNRVLFWDNNVHMETVDTGQVKTLGWEFYAGAHLGKYLDFFHYHHSRHIEDEPPQQDYNYPDSSSKFPVEDSWGVRIHLIPQGGAK